MKKTALLISLLVLMTLSPVNGQDALNTPRRVLVEADLGANAGNDVYFRVPHELAVVNHELWSEAASNAIYGTVDETRVFGSNEAAYSPITGLTNPEALYHLRNTSYHEQDIRFTADYYELNPDGDGDVQINNTVLFEDKTHIVRFNVNKTYEPMTISIMAADDDSQVDLDIKILSPSGMLSTLSVDLISHVGTFIPFVPVEEGIHLLVLTPTLDDTILKDLAIIGDLPYTDVEDGYSATAAGVNTFLQFFKLDKENLTNPGLLDFNYMTFLSDKFDNAKHSGLMGEIQIHYFGMNSGSIFGTTAALTDYIYSDAEVYVAVVVTPPDDADPYVRAEKAEYKLPEGYEFEFSFWFEKFTNLSELPINVDFTVDLDTEAPNNWYYYTVPEDTIVGINSSNTATAQFFNLDNPDDSVTFNSDDNDAINERTHDIIILKPGNYLVKITDNVAGDNSVARISTITTQVLEVGQNDIYSFNLDQVMFFEVPSVGLEHPWFNFTYTDYANMSVEFDFSYYDNNGERLSSKGFEFDVYGDDDEVIRASDWNNNTNLGVASYISTANMKGMYLRVKQTSNTLWNTTYTNPKAENPIWEDSYDVVSHLNISRLNYVDYLAILNPAHLYTQTDLVQGYNQFLNVDNTTIVTEFDYSPAQTGGNRIVFTSTNMSFAIYAFVGDTSLWYTASSPGIPEDVNGTDTYTLVLEFGTVVPMNFGFVVAFDENGFYNTNTNNGTFTVQVVETIDVQSLPSFTISSLSIGDLEDFLIEEPTDTTGEGSFLDNLTQEQMYMIGGATLGVIALSAGGIIIYRRRRF